MDETLVSFRASLTSAERTRFEDLLATEVNVQLSRAYFDGQDFAVATYTPVGAPAGAVPVTERLSDFA